MFPSPYWGLFFYLTKAINVGTATASALFPSPYWGLFFYLDTMEMLKEYFIAKPFPSPYWGLFFYPSRYFNQFKKMFNIVSVPVLGIIFLSLLSIVMITRAFKVQSSVESLQRYPYLQSDSTKLPFKPILITSAEICI